MNVRTATESDCAGLTSTRFALLEEIIDVDNAVAGILPCPLTVKPACSWNNEPATKDNETSITLETQEQKSVELKLNQSAIILEVDEEGEISVNVASGDQDGLTAQICQAIAMKLMSDENFQAEIMDMLRVEEE